MPTDDDIYIELWYANDAAGKVTHVKAYHRGKSSYWVPSEGVTVTKGYHLFDTYGEALSAAITMVRKEITKYENVMRKLEKL